MKTLLYKRSVHLHRKDVCHECKQLHCAKRNTIIHSIALFNVGFEDVYMIEVKLFKVCEDAPISTKISFEVVRETAIEEAVATFLRWKQEADNE